MTERVTTAEDTMRVWALFLSLAIAFFAFTSASLSGREYVGLGSASAEVVREAPMSVRPGMVVAQQYSARCSSAGGICYLPDLYPIGTPCSCGAYGGVIVP